jgi:hypothetical protein
MRRQVQQTGVRKWFGDDWLAIQDELLAVLEGFFGSYGQQFVVSGCEVSGNDIGPGIVGLIGASGFRLCRFAGAQGVSWPVYVYPDKVVENRVYLDNQPKPVAETWTAAISGSNPGGYLQIKQDGTTARFFDAIQTASRRFVTDAEKTAYAAQASNAIAAIRNGVSQDYDTLLKIAAALAAKAPLASPALTGTPTAPTAAAGTNTTQLATTAFVQAALGNSGFLTAITKAMVESVLTGEISSHSHAAGTLTKAMVEAVLTGIITSHTHQFGTTSGTFCQGNDSRLSDQRTPTDASVAYAKVAAGLKNAATVTGTVDLSAAAIGRITLTANTAFSFTGFELNKTYLLVITANGYTPSWASAAKHVPVDGNASFATSGVYYVSLTCIDATAGSEKLLTMIMKGA